MTTVIIGSTVTNNSASINKTANTVCITFCLGDFSSLFECGTEVVEQLGFLPAARPGRLPRPLSLFNMSVAVISTSTTGLVSVVCVLWYIQCELSHSCMFLVHL